MACSSASSGDTRAAQGGVPGGKVREGDLLRRPDRGVCAGLVQRSGPTGHSRRGTGGTARWCSAVRGCNDGGLAGVPGATPSRASQHGARPCGRCNDADPPAVPGGHPSTRGSRRRARYNDPAGSPIPPPRCHRPPPSQAETGHTSHRAAGRGVPVGMIDSRSPKSGHPRAGIARHHRPGVDHPQPRGLGENGSEATAYPPRMPKRVCAGLHHRHRRLRKYGAVTGAGLLASETGPGVWQCVPHGRCQPLRPGSLARAFERSATRSA